MKTMLSLDEWEAAVAARVPGVQFRWGVYNQAVRYATINGCDVAWFDAFTARPRGVDYNELPAGCLTVPG